MSLNSAIAADVQAAPYQRLAVRGPDLQPRASRPNAEGVSWDAARVAELERLWREDYTARQIAAKLGGVTRNAVLGKLLRLGLLKDGCPAKAAAARQRAAAKRLNLFPSTTRPSRPAPKPKPPKVEKPTPVTDLAQERARRLVCETDLVDLGPGCCKWPSSDKSGGEFRFCGRPAGTEVYCADHRSLAFRPTPPLRTPKNARLGQVTPRPEPRSRSRATFDKGSLSAGGW